MPKLDTRPFTALIEPSDIMWVDKGDGVGGYVDSRVILGSDLLAQMSALGGGNYYDTNLVSTGDRSHNQNDDNLTVIKAKTMRYIAGTPPDDSEASYIWRGVSDSPVFDFQNGSSQSTLRGNTSRQVAINSDSWAIGADLQLGSTSDMGSHKVLSVLDLAKTTGLFNVFGDGDVVFGGSGNKDITIGDASLSPSYQNIYMKNGTNTHYWGSYNSQMYLNSANTTNFSSNGTDVFQMYSGGIYMFGGKNFTFTNTTGTQIGTSPAERLAFYGTSPVARQILATGASATVDDVITFLQTIGLCQQS